MSASDIRGSFAARHESRISARLRGRHPGYKRSIALRVLYNLHSRLRNDQRKGIVGLVEIGLALDLRPALPPHLDHADFRQQRILDEGIEHQEAVVLLHEDVVDVIGLLLGGGHVLRPDRGKPHHLVARGENLHQRRHQAFDGVGDVARDCFGAPVRGRHVLRHVAHVIVERRRAFVGELRCGHRRKRVIALGGQQRLEIDRGHFRHGYFRLSAQPVVLESHREDRRRKEPAAQSDPPAPTPAGGAGIENGA